jgi:hypothetical protein
LRDNSYDRVPTRRITMATTAITRRTLAAAAAAALAVAALPFASSAASAADGAGHVSPRVAERAYIACIDGAPTTPDSHERWVTSCRERAAGGLMRAG